MARRAARVDVNQPEIVATLREAGYSVTPTHMVGNGFPDIVVGRNGYNWLVEIKDGDKPPSAQKLTDDEEKWHLNWRGTAIVANSAEDLLDQINADIHRV